MCADVECFEFKCHGKAVFRSYSSSRPVGGNAQQIPYAIHPVSFVYSKKHHSRPSLCLFFFRILSSVYFYYIGFPAGNACLFLAQLMVCLLTT